MQQGAAAIEDARGAATGERMELELAECPFDLKLKSEDWDLQVEERRIELVERQMTLPLSIQKQKLADHWVESMQRLDPDWRADARLQLQAKDMVCNTHMIEQRLAIVGPRSENEGAAAPRLERASLAISIANLLSS
jgi:hypothetical protein